MNPITRQEIYLNAIAGDGEVPANMEPLTREEYYLAQILERVDQMAQGGSVVKVKGDYPNYECLTTYAEITAMYSAGIMPSVALLNDSDEVAEIYAGTLFVPDVGNDRITLGAKYESYTGGESANVSVSVMYITVALDNTSEIELGAYYFSVTDDN